MFDATAAALANALIQGITLFAVTATVLAFTPRTNAASRHLIWCVVLIAVAALPFVTGEAAPAAQEDSAVPATTDGAPDHSLPLVATTSVATPEPTLEETRREVQRRFWSLPDIPSGWGLPLLLLLAIPAGMKLWQVGRGCRTLLRLRQTSAPLPDAYQKRVARIGHLIGCARPAEIRTSPMVSSPMTIGLKRPQLLMPCKLIEYLETRELDQILAHELGHVRRYDDWANLAQRVVAALLWFQPAVRWIGRRLDLEREVACDDAVVALTNRPRRLAACLTRLAEIAAGPRIAPLAPAAVGTRSQLSRRIHMLLDAQRNTAPRPSLFICFAVLGIAAIIGVPLVQALPTVGVAPLQTPQEVPPAPGAERPKASCCSSVVKVPEPPKVPEEDFGWNNSGCRWNVNYRGAVEMTPDLQDVRSVPEGGHVRITVKRGKTVLRYTVDRAPDGTCLRQFLVDGKEADLSDEDVQERLDDIMEEVCEHTALGARSRVARILRREGIDGVVEAIDDLDGGFVRRRYIEETLQVDDSPDTCAALGRAASRKLGQGHLVPAMAQIAHRHPGDQHLTYELVRVLRHVNNTSLRTRALTKVASVRPLTGLAARDFLAFARDSCSGCGRPEILTRSMQFYLNDPQLRGEYFTALENCNSAEVRRAVVRAVLDRNDLDEELMTQLVRVVEKLRSTYEKARALAAVARRTKSTTLVDTVIEAARNLNHDGARKVLLDAVLMRKDLTGSNVDRILSVLPNVQSTQRKAALLLATLPHCPTDALSQVLEVGQQLSNDPDRRQVLAAVLDRKDLDAYTLQRVFESLRHLQSDARKAALLVRAAPRTENALVIPYLETTFALRSDAEKSRALMALLGRKELAAEHIARIKKHVPESFRTKSARESMLAAVDARLATDDD